MFQFPRTPDELEMIEPETPDESSAGIKARKGRGCPKAWTAST